MYITVVQAASAITNHFNQQELGVSDGEGLANSPLSQHMSRLLSAARKTDDGTITPSEISQKHICEKVAQRYPSAIAIELLKEAESMGFGRLEDTKAPIRRKILSSRSNLIVMSSEGVNSHPLKLTKTEWSQFPGSATVNAEGMVGRCTLMYA